MKTANIERSTGPFYNSKARRGQRSLHRRWGRFDTERSHNRGLEASESPGGDVIRALPFIRVEDIADNGDWEEEKTMFDTRS
jgi:hypothetical protein